MVRDESTSVIDAWLLKLADQLGLAPRPEQYQAIRDVQSRHSLTVEEFARGINGALDDPDGFWPRPGKFLAMARPKNPAIESVESHSAFEAIKRNRGLAMGHYDPDTGTHWDFGKVEKMLGPAAKVAFLAIGGSWAFKTMDPENEQWRRKEFVEAYTSTARSALSIGQARRPAIGPSRQEAAISKLIGGKG